MKRIFIGLPAYQRQIDVEILFSVLRMQGEYQYEFDYIGSSIITDARNYLVKRFLDSDNEWLYFWDADIVVKDANLFTKLIETSENLDAAIVGAAYRLKNRLGLVVGGNQNEEGQIKNLESSGLKTPILVDAVGTGTMLIRRDVLTTMQAPWFEFVTTADHVQPEDYNFCLKAKKLGFKVALDPRILTLHYGPHFWEHIPPQLRDETETYKERDD